MRTLIPVLALLAAALPSTMLRAAESQSLGVELKGGVYRICTVGETPQLSLPRGLADTHHSASKWGRRTDTLLLVTAGMVLRLLVRWVRQRLRRFLSRLRQTPWVHDAYQPRLPHRFTF